MEILGIECPIEHRKDIVIELPIKGRLNGKVRAFIFKRRSYIGITIDSIHKKDRKSLFYKYMGVETGIPEAVDNLMKEFTARYGIEPRKEEV